MVANYCYCLIGRRTFREGRTWNLVVGEYIHKKGTPHYWDMILAEDRDLEKWRDIAILPREEPLFKNVKGEWVDPRKEFEDEYWYSLIQDFPEATSVSSYPCYDAETGRRWASPVHEQGLRKDKGNP